MSIVGASPFTERIAFFDGQRLFASDLQFLEQFNREMRWLHNRSLHQPGIGSGFAVSGNKGDREVRIEPGYAIDNLGRAGQVVKVAAGYARNYLLPRKLAYPATPGKLKVIEFERKSLLRKEAKQKDDAEKLKTMLDPIEIVIRRKVGEQDALYGSVTNSDVADELEKKCFQIEKRKIHMDDHIKALGEYSIPIRLFKDVTANVKLKVEPETEGQ